MNDKGMIDSSSVNLLKPEIKSQFKLIKDQKSNRMNDVLINGVLPVTLCSNI